MVPRSVSYQQNLPWYSLQPHSMQFICTLYRNVSANVLCGDKALNVKLQKGQRGMHWERSVFSCSLKSCIATDERDMGRQRRPLHAHTNSHFMAPPYLCFPRVVCEIVEGGRSSERLAETGLFREWGRTEEKLVILHARMHMEQQPPVLGAQEPTDLQLGGHYPAIFVDFLEASAPVVVGSPRHVCLVETHILLFWLSQDSNFCNAFPIYLQLWQYKSACVGIVYANFIPFQIWTLVQSWSRLGFNCLHKSPAYPDESRAKKCVEHAVAAFEPSLSLNNQLQECQNSQSLVLCTCLSDGWCFSYDCSIS